ncbi:hypothetical protein M1432_03260 [Patescibacteria group bacterium]|nr:hypothetical protein [Patescibacteria group bacterium]
MIGLIVGMFAAAIGLITFAMTDVFGDKARYYAGFASFWSVVFAALCSFFLYDFEVPTHGIVLIALIAGAALAMPMSLRKKVKGGIEIDLK